MSRNQVEQTQGLSNCLTPFLMTDARVHGWLESTCASALIVRDYRSLLYAARETGSQHARNSCVSDRLIAERAFEAEGAIRGIASVGLDALNVLRDANQIRNAWRTSRKNFAKGFTGKDVQSALAAAQRRLGTTMPSIEQVFGDLQQLVQEMNLKARWIAGGLDVECMLPGGQSRKLHIPDTTGPFEMGNVFAGNLLGSESVSGASMRVLTGIGRVRDPITRRRHTGGDVDEKYTVTDQYAAAVSALTLARDVFYRHARQVQEIGISGIQGSQPIVALIIIICVLVGVTMAIAGSEYLECRRTGDSTHCTFAALLLTFGLLSAFVAATFRPDLVRGAFALDGLRMPMGVS